MEILAKEFNFQTPAGITPGRNADLAGSAPGFGAAQTQVEGAGRRDVRHAAAGLRGQVSEHGDAVRGSWDPGAVDQFASAGRREVAASAEHAQGAIRSDKQSRLGAIIEQHAALPRTAAQVAENEAGGLLSQAAGTVALAGAGVGGVTSQAAAGAAAFGKSLKEGHGLRAAVQAGRAAAGSEAGWTGARDAMVDARMNQISSYGLSPAQEQLYRTTTTSVLSGGSGSKAHQAAHQAVIAESSSPRRGEQIADLIERSASTKDDTDLRLIGAYNEQTQPASAEKKSPEPRLGRADIPLSSPIANSGHYPVSSGFSQHRVHPITGEVRPHRGVDFKMPPGTPVLAAGDGVVHTGHQEHGAGNFLSVDHGGEAATRYMHLERFAVEDGQAVRRGDVIGYSGNSGGSTGPHLHFEVWRDGEAVDPQHDPLTHLGGPGPSGHGVSAVAAAATSPAPNAAGGGHHQGAVVAPASLRGVFAAAEVRHGLPPGMLTAVAAVESHFNLNAVSSAGAQGMFGMMPGTAKDLGVANPFDPREAAEGAASMILTMLATAGRILHRLRQDRGQYANALFRECGMDPLKLNDAKARCPLDRARTLWRLVQQRIPDPCWGLAVGEIWRPTDYHALGYAFLASRTLEEALMRLERHSRIVFQDIHLQIIINQDSLRITYLQPSTEADLTVLQDAQLSVILRMCRDVYGPDLPLREVQLSHPWQACDYVHYFGCQVQYDRDSSGLTFGLDTVRKALPAVSLDLAKGNDQILKDLDDFLTGTAITHRVRREIVRKLTSGKPSAKDVAREWALAPRTLQRKLQEKGTTYKKVSEDVRKQLAERYVRSGKTLIEVTYLTGFANQSAFSRAYKAWTGRSPSEDHGRG